MQRTEGGWAASTLNQYVEHGDETTYRLKFRVSKKTFDYVVGKLSSAGFVTDNKCMDPAKRMTARFKCGVAFYFLAHAEHCR